MATLRTIAYPPSIENGDLKLATNGDRVFGHIKAVLETRPQERVMRPLTFGFDPDLFGAISIQLTSQRVEDAVSNQVVDISRVFCQGSYDESGLVNVQLFYEDKEGNQNKGGLTIG